MTFRQQVAEALGVQPEHVQTVMEHSDGLINVTLFIPGDYFTQLRDAALPPLDAPRNPG